MMCRCLPKYAILNHGLIWMKHNSFCSRESNLDVEIPGVDPNGSLRRDSLK